MSTIKRLDPRRPFHMTSAGLRRIVLGETGVAANAVGPREAAKPTAPKPLRPRTGTQRWLMAVVHSDRGSLDEHARQAIAAAAILASPETAVLAVVFGELHESLAPLGADRVAVFPALNAGRFAPEAECAVVQALLAAYNPAHVFLPDTATGEGDLGRRLIAAHGSSFAAHVVELDAGHVAVPWSGGTALAQGPLPKFALLDAGAVDVALPFRGPAEIVPANELPQIAGVAAAFRDNGLEAIGASTIPLEEADLIVSAGNGVANVATLEALAAALGASVGASRVAVDDGKFPRDKQIGATGKSVSASAYIAVGISGAVQHLQGIKDCRHVIAVNRDAGAPIVKRADLTVTGDAEEIMQALITRIGQARAQREIPEAT